MGLTPPLAPLRRVGVFGGAFDPPHAAHVALAQAALAELQLDELRVVPTGQAWHRSRAPSAARHRLAMARLAFAGVPKVVVDPVETQRSGPSYTVETLREYHALWPDAELFLLLGDDQAHALASWQGVPEILQLAIICVAGRAHSTGPGAQFPLEKEHLSRFRRLSMPEMPISATDIRSRIAAHQSVEPLVFAAVARYIEDHHLYQTT